jgi:MFS family permease
VTPSADELPPAAAPIGAVLARLIAGMVFIHACMAGMRMATPLLALREGYGAVSVGVLLSLFALMQVFLALPAGRYADRHGMRRPMRLAVAVATAGAGLAFAWPSYPALCLAALMTGGATGIALIALQRHAGRIAAGPAQLRRVFSWLAIGPAISSFIGPFAAGLLIDHGGFRAAFLAMALLPLGGWYFVRHTGNTPVAESSAPASRGGAAWDLLAEPGMRRLLVVNWILASCWDVHTFLVPVLGHERGLSASTIGTLLGAFAIAALAIRLVLPMLAAQLAEWKVIATAMGATALVFALYPFARGPLAMGACSVMLGLALGAVQPMVMSTLYQITPTHRQGEALGLRLMTVNVSSVMMPLLFGATGAVVGAAGVFWSVGAVVGGGVRLAFGLRQRS